MSMTTVKVEISSGRIAEQKEPKSNPSTRPRRNGHSLSRAKAAKIDTPVLTSKAINKHGKKTMSTEKADISRTRDRMGSRKTRTCAALHKHEIRLLTPFQ